MAFKRHPQNPILTAQEIPYPATLIFNAGVVKHNGRYVMIFRNDYGLSEEEFRAGKKLPWNGPQFYTQLGLATSEDGYRWKVDPEPVWEWHDDEVLRVYDPRLTVIEGSLYLCFATDTHHGIRGGIAAVSENCRHVEVLYLSFPENRNMVLFPEKIQGQYWRLERPFPMYGQFGRKCFDIWTGSSPDLRHWGNHQLLLTPEEVPFANTKLGPAAPPIKTDQGWLTTFHSVWEDDSMRLDTWEEKWSRRYEAGLMLLDLNNPAKVLAYSRKPILSPEADYEVNGFRGSVIFPGGMILEDDKTVKMYYGASDTVTCMAEARLDDLWDLMDLA